MPDFSTLLTDSGVDLGALTLAAAARAAVTLIVGVVLIRVLLSLTDRGFARSERLRR